MMIVFFIANKSVVVQFVIDMHLTSDPLTYD